MMGSNSRIKAQGFFVISLVIIMFLAGYSSGTEKNYGFDYAFDAYYTWAELYIGLQAEPDQEEFQEEDEIQIYKTLLAKSFIPKFLVFELSVNPLPCLGVFTRKQLSGFYDSTEVLGVNLVRAVCTGFEEPAAFSMLVGNLVDFKPAGEAEDVKGKAYMGYLASLGNYHIKDNELIDDNWLELEWKMKGERISATRNMKWSYRVGGKLHGNSEVRDVFYLSLVRGRVDHDYFGWSFLKNSNFEYVFDFSAGPLKIVRHYIILGKSFPSKKSKFVFTLDLGFLWEGGDKYTGSLRRPGAGEHFQLILRPNIMF